MTLKAETTHGDLDLSFGSVIQRPGNKYDHQTYMVVAVRDKTLDVDVVTLDHFTLQPGAAHVVPWVYIDQYEQVP